MNVYNSSKNIVIATQVKVAKNFFTRTIGLLSRKSLSKEEGLVIKPCSSIHTFFMKFAIDVLFVNKKGQIIALYENVKPWRILPLHFTSSYVIELPAGMILDKNIDKGDVVRVD